MRAAVIGTSGHTDQFLAGIEAHGKTQLAGFAPCCGEEAVKQGLVKQICGKFGTTVYDNWETMLDQVKPDVVGITAWFSLAADRIIACLERGISVVSDKPAATTLRNLDRIKAAHAKAGPNVHFSALHAMRCRPAFLALHQIVQEGRLGTITLMSGQKSYKLGQRPEFHKKRETHGGFIPWVGIHAIDWFHWYSPCAFTSVYASHTRHNNFDHGDLEISAVITLTMENSGAACANLDYRNPKTNPLHGDDRVRLAGDLGVAEIRHGKTYLATDTQEPHEVELPPGRVFFKDFLDQMEGKGRCLVRPEDVFRVTEIALKARQAADEKRVVGL
jgi:predicted dehydrogenase